MTKIINILNLSSFLAQSIARLTEEKNVAKFITVIVFVCNSPTPYDHLNVLFLRHFRLYHIYFPLKCKRFSLYLTSFKDISMKKACCPCLFLLISRSRCLKTRSISEPDLNAPITFKYFVHLITQERIPACIAAKQKLFPRKKGLFYYRAQHTPEYVLASVLLCTLHRKNDIRIPVHKWEETRREKWPCRGSF